MNRALVFILLALPLAAQQADPDADNPLERARWFFGQRAGPDGSLRAADRLRAFRLVERMRQSQVAAASVGKAASSADWTLIGPQPTDPPPGSTAGRVSAIAVDPRDPNVVYLGGAEGGVWKTTDGGVHWTPMTDSQPSLAMGSIALDPSNPDIVYAGTGEANGCQDCYYGAGILKSTDRGATWTQLPGPFIDSVGRGATIASLAVHPTNGQILLAAVSLSGASGIYRSTDGAVTWSRVQSGSAGTNVVFDPSNPNIAYAALFTTGIYKSLDAGISWVRSNGTGTSAITLTNADRIEMAIAPSQPSTLYVSVGATSGAGGNLLGFYKTTDGAQTWISLGNNPDYCTPQCWYANVVRVDPANPDTVYMGGFNVHRSINGGSNWMPITNGNNVHVDHHGLAFANNGRLYNANDGGVYSSDNPAAVSPPPTWANLNGTLAITEFYPSLSIHPANPSISLAGTQDNGTQRYNGTPTWSSVTCGDGGWTIIDPAQPTTVYSTCQNIAIRKSTNNGNLGTWASVVRGIDLTDRVRFIPPFVIDPSNTQRLYFGTYRLYQSNDAAGSWAVISPDLTGGGAGKITAIGVAPGDPYTVYVGTDNVSTISIAASDVHVQVTRNALAGAGALWTERTAGLPQRYPTQIAVDAANSSIAYITFSGFSGRGGDSLGHVFKTTNAGITWTDISGNLPNIPVNDIVLDPDLPGVMYLGTDMGVFRTTDGGANWLPLGAGLPRVVVMAIRLHRPSRTLRAATHGRSIWDLDVPLPAGFNVVPGLSSISPLSAKTGDAAATLTVNGASFVPGSLVMLNGVVRPTTFVSSGQLTATLSAADLAKPGIFQVSVSNPAPGGGNSNSINFTVALPAAANAGGTVSAASFRVQPLAPGSIASVFGSNLAVSDALANVLPLPLALNNVTVRLNGAAAPVVFVSPLQVNFQIPWELSSVTAAALTINVGAVAGTAQSILLATYSPGIFSTGQTGGGQGTILIANSAILAAALGTVPGSRPAMPGEVVSIFCTGLGPVTSRPASGAAALGDPLSNTTTMPTVTIGGQPATVTFAGLAPGFAGLYQVNVTVPDNTPSGSAVTVNIAAGGVASNNVTIAVQ